MEFTEHDPSGHLIAEGVKGQYWIMENAWVYLELVTGTYAGPHIEKVGTFHEVEDAIIAANIFDAETVH